MTQQVAARHPARGWNALVLVASLAALPARASPAGVVSLYADAYALQENGLSFSVIDLYATFPDTAYQVAGVFGDVSLLGGQTWFHDDLTGACPDGGTWLPVTSTAHPLADSFVPIGMPLFGLPNATLLAPTFEDDPACSSFLGPATQRQSGPP